MSNEVIRVAVYGTLRKGFGNNRLLAGLDPVLARVEELPYRMVSLGAFPGLIESTETNGIFIEVYEVDQERLKTLDSLEGYRGPDRDNFYDRATLEIDGQNTFIYTLPEDHYGDRTTVSSGNWRDYVDGMRHV